MKTTFFTALLTLALTSNAAFAGACDPSKRTIRGEKAKSLIAALKISGVKSVTGPVSPINNKGHETDTQAAYSVASVKCTETNGGVFDDGLDSYSCNTGPSRALKNEANAKILIDAIEELGTFADGGMSKSYQEISGVRCVVTMGEQIAYRCSVTAVWADTCKP